MIWAVFVRSMFGYCSGGTPAWEIAVWTENTLFEPPRYQRQRCSHGQKACFQVRLEVNEVTTRPFGI